MSENIAVVGSGAFGTALAAVIALAGRSAVTLVGRDPSLIADLKAERLHDAVLPGILLPDTLEFSAEADAVVGASIVLFAMPSQAQADAARQYGPYLSKDAVVVTCAKGIERTTGNLLTDMLERELPDHPIAVLSGPGFAADIAKGLPTAMAIAAADMETAERLAQAISGRTFRLYASNDRIGVQLGGALKNVLAIACGIVEGCGIGDSARAALIARGLAEMSRFVVAKGGQADTVRGLSGLGDLVLTATSHQSRNLRFGIALGRGDKTDPLHGALVEGAFAASVASRLAAELKVSMPITDAVSAIIDGRLDISEAIEQLMTRPITTE
ncbi:NAD(P)H-dependent glycerol-3-phosphate dehydrogenase [Rhizobium leguminosarum]|uniref:NAD(P)H-dependent glycerol-3-phosphate dehydrogenase n=1 Tax=Rhizobium TaxID=379 RepID=UPI0004126804|nr:NAD(P)H-dependent glycerol-3-phosphate dehydrogenase [Rhizobium leguminosarum]MBY5913792.1 NAD(P)-dependent glycerol-3-phosphate dehydrogenase [Rhizobium leguminosarum]RWX42764.1 NAD(P)-dependent glycerol-3-phosphate dehydrogenase [Rhizobium leguminosarum]TBE56699.1 NAD(P)-dependent glycerol-3-phosphate dehydrogenase [Rhizobium leguminosarum]TBE94295.1 NAD(P)-dependent glycerol-3-phosphate dehydrogenase [Rhizobium leguminosarum]TBZ50179.1 NAD(P)-dependent glycerol-3-phosphate dehydrogenase 